MSRPLPAALLLLALLLARPAAAAAAAPPAALEQLADGLAADLRARHPEPPLALSVSAPSAPLARALATLLAARLPGLAPTVLEAAGPEAAEALARERGARSLARLSLRLEAGALQAQGDLLGTWVNFWSGRTPTRPPAPAAALARTVTADAGALALAASSPAAPVRGAPPSLRGALLAQLPGRTAALAAGDLDGDGREELAVLLRLPSGAEELLLLDGTGRVLARHGLEGLSPTPTREPFGALAFQAAPRRLLVRSAAREAGEALVLQRQPEGALALVAQARIEGPAPLGASARAPLVEGRALLGPELQWGGALRASQPFVAASLWGRGAAEERLLLVFPDGTGALYARPGDAAPAALQALGAGSALADVDGDGLPELLTTAAELAPAPERLRLFSLQGGPPAGAAAWETALPRGRGLQLVGVRLEPGAAQQVVVACWLEDGTTELSLFRQVTP